MIDYRIETFLELCDTMNYRRTAERLHITQPAVTRHIQFLEQQYGCKLFDYDKRRLSLTPQGEVLLRYARSMAYQERRMADELAGKPGLHLRIGATKTVGDYAIGPHLAAFLARPANTLETYVDNTVHLLHRIERGELDFAVVEGLFDRRRFESRLYSEERFVGLCAAGHRFAGRTVTLGDAMGECLFLRERGSGTRAILEQTLAERNRNVEEFARVATVSSFGLMTQLLAATGGITFGYDALRRHDGRLAAFEVEGWDIVREFNYVFLGNDTARGMVESFDGLRPSAAEE